VKTSSDVLWGKNHCMCFEQITLSYKASLEIRASIIHLYRCRNGSLSRWKCMHEAAELMRCSSGIWIGKFESMACTLHYHDTVGHYSDLTGANESASFPLNIVSA
jgi:hypothetical protein